MELIDRNAAMQVIGSLLKNPFLYAQVEKDLDVSDFPNSFTRNIFVAISNLYRLGADKVTVVDIDNYLQQFGAAYVEFQKQNGITYIQDCTDIAYVDNFDYYFTRLKKFSALRKLQKSGIDVSDIYRDDHLDAKQERAMMDKFDSMSVQDIFDHINSKISAIEFSYDINKKIASEAVDGIAELKEEFKRSPEVGPSLMGHYYNLITRGARKGKYYINSSGSGVGKSRGMIGNACRLAYPVQYDVEKKEWVTVGAAEKTLIITTELRKDEVQSIILANLSGVNQSRILYGNYTGDEEERVDQAIEVMRKYPNLYIQDIPDPNINLIKNVVKKHVNLNGIVNLFYDYIFSSPNLLGEFRDLKIREDVALLMLSTALKDMAVEYNIYVETATQLSGDYENFQGVRNHTLLRGSKSISDKADCGCITALVTEKDKDKLRMACKMNGFPMPNEVKDIYKLRRGQYKNVRIWGLMDLGTARWVDLFVTDGNYNVIPIDIPEVQFVFKEPVEENQQDITVQSEITQVQETVAVVKEKKKFDAWSYGF